MNRTFNVTNYIKTVVKVFTGELDILKAHKNVHNFSGSDATLTWSLTALCSPLCTQWEEVSGLDEENNSVRIYEICQIGSSSSHWLRSGFIQRQGASQVYVELRFTMMECSSTSTHHRSCKETFNLYYYQADSNEATSSYPPWMENPYIKVRPQQASRAVWGYVTYLIKFLNKPALKGHSTFFKNQNQLTGHV